MQSHADCIARHSLLGDRLELRVWALSLAPLSGRRKSLVAMLLEKQALSYC